MICTNTRDRNIQSPVARGDYKTIRVSAFGETGPAGNREKIFNILIVRIVLFLEFSKNLLNNGKFSKNKKNSKN